MSKKKIYIISLAIIIPVIIIAAGMLLKGSGKDEADGPVYKVKRGPLTISFVESGTIKAREQTIIKNEVEGRTSIISIIPEGTQVKEGDLLVELDVSSLEDKKVDQEISVQNTEASYIGAKENLAVTENQAKSDVALATLTLEFSRQDLEKYISGEYPYELDKSEAEIGLAEEELTRAEETLKWSKQLYEEKYISQTELQADELSKKKKTLDVELAKKSKNLLKDYTYQRKLAQLKSDVSQAEMAMERTERKANANVIQAQAELKARESEYERQKDKLKKVEDQISKTKIYAPTDGLAIYATSATGRWWQNEPLAEGTEVQEREELIYLPTGNSSKAEVTIHESNLKKTSKGMPAIITIDAIPGKTFYGTVETIAPLPDARSMWMNPDLKVYKTEIYIDGNDPMLRTGMSCQTEIIVQQLEDALYVPLQAVIRIGKEPTVYVKKGNASEPQTIKTGFDNNKMIHILEGIDEGQVVLLNPPLKSAGVDSENRNLPEQTSEDNTDGIRQKVSERLKNISKDKSLAEANQPANAESPDMQKSKEQSENLDPEKAKEMRKKLEQMSPEERKKAMGQTQGSNRSSGSRRQNRSKESQ
ncbi:MAG: efflux transporter periplasmic adaptor subunit [Planctomycetes bacterium]|nr:efflux transporter periplasmic adaptor subunit [Planctomycetota bacterium]MBU1517842.1 efflux transporter periplasmic adaptor subunit [Planctomycetota bacterium]MBU2457396.1 efflux transporter periplasmic adaptor subunit [Planctomycetota bacterium]